MGMDARPGQPDGSGKVLWLSQQQFVSVAAGGARDGDFEPAIIRRGDAPAGDGRHDHAVFLRVAQVVGLLTRSPRSEGVRTRVRSSVQNDEGRRGDQAGPEIMFPPVITVPEERST